MFKIENSMYVFEGTIRTAANMLGQYSFTSNDAIIKVTEDLFGNEITELNTSCAAFEFFSELFNNNIIAGLDLRDNFKRALARRKNKSKGIKVFYTLDGVRHYVWVWFECVKSERVVYR